MQQEQTSRFRLSRFNRYIDYYDYDGDWGWFTVNIDEDKEQFYNLEIPLTTDNWLFNVFTISKENGIGILDDPIPFSSQRPIHFYCEGPSEIHRGESVGVRCMIMNRSPLELETVIILKGSKPQVIWFLIVNLHRHLSKKASLLSIDNKTPIVP